MGPRLQAGQQVVGLPGLWATALDAGVELLPTPEEPDEVPLPRLGVRPSEVRRLVGKGKKTTWITDRGEIQGRDRRANFEARLHPHMVKVGHGLYANGRRIRSLWNPPRSKHFRLVMDDGWETLVGQTGKSPMWWRLSEDLGLPHLYFLEPRSERVRVMEHEGLRDWPRLLLDMPAGDLRARFGEDPRGLFFNALMQLARARAHGLPLDYGFDHRGVWYLLGIQLLRMAGLAHDDDPVVLPPGHLGPSAAAWAALEWLARSRNELYVLWEGVLTDLVGVYAFCDYRDLGFTDPKPELRFLGTARPEVLLVAEKSTLLPAVRALVQRFGCSAIVLGGQPSYLVVEFLAEALHPLLKGKPIVQVDYCDHDPGGYIIGSTLTRHLARYGLAVERRCRLIRPERFTAEEIRRFALPLEAPTPAIRERILNWIRETGGIGGRGLGLHADLLRPLERVIRAFLEETGLAPL